MMMVLVVMMTMFLFSYANTSFTNISCVTGWSDIFCFHPYLGK